MRRTLIRWVVLALLLVLTSCKGSGGDDSSTESSSSEEGASSDENASATEEPTAEEGEPEEEGEPDASAASEPTASNGGGTVQPRDLAGSYQHVPNEVREETETGKAKRVIRQLTNYTMGVASGGDPPADQAALAAALLEQYQLEWPNDPWGTPYQYETDGSGGFSIHSAGPDGEESTDDDIHVSE